MNALFSTNLISFRILAILHLTDLNSTAEGQLREVRDLLDRYHVSSSISLQVLKSYLTDDNGSQSIDGIHTSNSKIKGQRKTGFHLDYLVFGYYVNKRQNYQNENRDNPLHNELYDIIIENQSIDKYAHPWSKDEPILIDEREQHVNVVMSPFTAVLGTVSGFDCFCEGTFYKKDFNETRIVQICSPHNPTKIEIYLVKVVVVPRTYPNWNCINLCKKIESDRFQNDASHYV